MLSSFLFSDPAATEIYTLSLHDALPICRHAWPVTSARRGRCRRAGRLGRHRRAPRARSEEHTSELQSLRQLVCRLLLEKKKTQKHKSWSRSRRVVAKAEQLEGKENPDLV